MCVSECTFIHVLYECMFDAWTEIAEGIYLMEQFQISCDDTHTPAQRAHTHTHTPYTRTHRNIRSIETWKYKMWKNFLNDFEPFSCIPFTNACPPPSLSLLNKHWPPSPCYCAVYKGAKIVWICGHGWLDLNQATFTNGTQTCAFHHQQLDFIWPRKCDYFLGFKVNNI